MERGNILRSFVQAARKAVLNARQGKGRAGGLTLVLGNEGGDMDSVVSSIYTAMLYTLLEAQHSSANKALRFEAFDFEDYNLFHYIPAMNFPYEDLPLRGDIEYLLDTVGVQAKDLLWIDAGSTADAEESTVVGAEPDSPSAVGGVDETAYDLLTEKISSTKTVAGELPPYFQRVLLVDHNKPCARQMDLVKGHVIGIIDHHADEGFFLECGKKSNAGGASEEGLHSSSSSSLALAFPRLVSTVGSCASHVSLLYKEYGVEVVDPTALLAPILLDTMNLDPNMKKVTPKDIEAVEYILSQKAEQEQHGSASTGSVGSGSGGEGERIPHHKTALDEQYRVLSEKKNDVSHLTLPQSLRRDFKAFPCPIGSPKPVDAVAKLAVGISAVVEMPEPFMQRISGGVQGVAHGVLSHARRQHCDMGMIMFAAEDPATKVFTRSLLVVVPDGFYVLPSSSATEDHHCPTPAPETMLTLMRGFIEANSGSGTMGLALATEAIHSYTTDTTAQDHHHPQKSMRTLFCTQKDSAVSRKGLVPALMKFLAGDSPSSSL